MSLIEILAFVGLVAVIVIFMLVVAPVLSILLRAISAFPRMIPAIVLMGFFASGRNSLQISSLLSGLVLLALFAAIIVGFIMDLNKSARILKALPQDLQDLLLNQKKT